MARDLWISSATGARRRGTTWSEITRLLETGITAESVYETLLCCGKDWSPNEVKHLLDKLFFDVVGVTDKEGNPPIGYTHLTELDGACTDGIPLQDFSPNELIAYGAPLADVFTSLEGRDQVFILGRHGVEGIVTRADLNKSVARMYLFSLVSLLETHLAFWIRTTYPNDSWIRTLEPRRLEKAERFQRMRREANQELDLIECLQFCDKANLVRSNGQALASLGIDDDEATGVFAQIEALRNNLAHSQEDVAVGLDWSSILPAISRVGDILAASDLSLENTQRKAGEEVPE